MTAFNARIVFLAAVGVSLAGEASAAPYGGASLLSAHTEVHAMRGFRSSPPDLIESGTGMRVHGSVCRMSRMPTAAPRHVRVVHRDSGLRVIGAAVGNLAGNLSSRDGLSCAYYDVPLARGVSPGDSVVVCVAGRPDEAGCADAG